MPVSDFQVQSYDFFFEYANIVVCYFPDITQLIKNQKFKSYFVFLYSSKLFVQEKSKPLQECKSTFI